MSVSRAVGYRIFKICLQIIYIGCHKHSNCVSKASLNFRPRRNRFSVNFRSDESQAIGSENSLKLCLTLQSCNLLRRCPFSAKFQRLARKMNWIGYLAACTESAASEKLLFQLLAAWKNNKQQDIFSCPTINRNSGQINAE